MSSQRLFLSRTQPFSYQTKMYNAPGTKQYIEKRHRVKEKINKWHSEYMGMHKKEYRIGTDVQQNHKKCPAQTSERINVSGVRSPSDRS